MKVLHNYIQAAALLLVTLTSIASAENKVLFLGNSFTLGSGGARSVPDIFDALARAAGQDDPTTVIAAVGGIDYQYHYENHQAQIASQQWTHVVMQNYSTEPTHTGHVSDHMTYGALLYDSIMLNDPATQVHLYQTWARSAIHPLISGTSTSRSFESTDEMLSELVTNYQALADALNTGNSGNPTVKVDPVGQAWNNAGGNLHPNDPNYIDLFSSDEYHGNSLGYYLSACVHYAAIYQDSPEGLYSSAEVTALNLNLNGAEAVTIESIAWQTVVAADLAKDLPDTRPLSLTSLSEVDANTLTVQFNDQLDESTAINPANYTIINRGHPVAIDNVVVTGMKSGVTITTATELEGSILVEVSTDLLDDAGNALAGTTRMNLQVMQSLPGSIYIDFGGVSTVTGTSTTWNPVALNSTIRNAVGNGTGTPAVLLSDLLDASGAATGISLTMTDTLSSTNASGTTSGPYPSGATSDSLYGYTGSFNGFTDNDQAVFVFSNLNLGTSYDFTFYASRISTTDNRESEYTLSGVSSHSVTLNAADNTYTIVQILEMQPNASGDITLTITKGANNDTSNGFYYIGAVVIDS